MIELLTVERVVLSILVNGVGLAAVMLLKSAPPRLVLYICLASMLAILFPLSSIGTGVVDYLPIDVVAEFNVRSVAKLELAWERIVALWLVISVIWIVAAIMRSARTRKKWRSSAASGKSLVKYADPFFTNELRRTRIHRLPNTSLVYSSGLRYPEIWVGSGVRTDAQIRVALNHELAHIASKDQLTLLVLVVTERLLWWNPLIWFLGRQARRQMEYACDSRCQALMGANHYRQTLAELFLGKQPRRTSLEIQLGNGSDIIARLEKIGMTHSLNLKHIITMIFACTLITTTSANLAFGHGQEISADYDTSNLVEISGTVVGYEPKDPHSLLFVDVTENGRTIPWTVVGGRAAGIANAGLSHTYLMSQPNVTVQLYETKDKACAPRCLGLGQSFNFDRSLERDR